MGDPVGLLLGMVLAVVLAVIHVAGFALAVSGRSGPCGVMRSLRRG